MAESRKNNKSLLFLGGIFLISQLFFLGLDGTVFSPNVRDDGSLAGRVMHSELLTEGLGFYENPSFTLITILLFLALLLALGRKVFQSLS